MPHPIVFELQLCRHILRGHLANAMRCACKEHLRKPQPVHSNVHRGWRNVSGKAPDSQSRTVRMVRCLAELHASTQALSKMSHIASHIKEHLTLSHINLTPSHLSVTTFTLDEKC